MKHDLHQNKVTWIPMNRRTRRALSVQMRHKPTTEQIKLFAEGERRATQRVWFQTELSKRSLKPKSTSGVCGPWCKSGSPKPGCVHAVDKTEAPAVASENAAEVR